MSEPLDVSARHLMTAMAGPVVGMCRQAAAHRCMAFSRRDESRAERAHAAHFFIRVERQDVLVGKIVDQHNRSQEQKTIAWKVE
jgi:hypothetical protein